MEKLKIWIAENDPLVIKRSKEILETAGYDVMAINEFKDTADLLAKLQVKESELAVNEKKHRTESQQISELFSLAPSCICILKGKDYIYEMANPMYLQVTGKKNIIGKKAKDVFPELVEQGFLGLLDNVYKTGVPLAAKEVYIQLDIHDKGVLTDHYMDFVYQPFKDEHGDTAGIFFFANLVTEQVVARQKIEQKEKHFRALVENASDLIILTDETGNLTYVSPAHEKLTGCKPVEVLGRSFFTFQHPDHVADLKMQFTELLRNPGKPMPRTTRFRHRNGGYIWVEGTVTNLLDDENVQGVIGNFRDVTERKLAEEKIIHANRLYAFISHINQTIVHAGDEEELYRAACNIAVGVGKYKIAWIGLVDITTKTVNLVEEVGISETDRELFRNAAYTTHGPQDQAITSGTYYVCNNVANDMAAAGWRPFAAKYSVNSCMVLPIKKSGKIIATLNLYSTEIDLFDTGEIRLLLEIAGDISYAIDVFEKEKHRRQMEEKIRHSELRLKQAQSIAHFGSWELDYETGVSVWSEEFCRIYGLSPDECMQSYPSWLSYVHPDDLVYVKRVTNEARKASTGFSFHHRIIRKDGAIRYIFSQAEFEFAPNGKPVSLHGVAHDITEIKESEKERSKIIADMVQRNNDLEQFSYIISHNLRGPVANILGLVDIVKTIGIDKDEVAGTTAFLDTAAQNLDRVITDLNQILGLKNNAGLKREPINFAALLEEVKLSIIDNRHDDQVTINGDFSAVEQMTTVKSYLYSIFFNLILNSMKYRRPDVPPVIEIRSARVNNKIQLTFRDNGLGIDLKKSGDNVFRLYKRFHNHVEGKGMGLFMVKTQVDLLGGKISVASEINKGCEFTIEFEEKDNLNL